MDPYVDFCSALLSRKIRDLQKPEYALASKAFLCHEDTEILGHVCGVDIDIVCEHLQNLGIWDGDGPPAMATLTQTRVKRRLQKA